MTGPYFAPAPKSLLERVAPVPAQTAREKGVVDQTKDAGLTEPLAGPTRALARAQRLAIGEKPENARRVLDLSRRTGYDTEFVRENLEALEKESAAPDFDPVAFARHSPLTAEWLGADPTRTVLLGKDYRALGTWERQIRGIAEGFHQSARNMERTRLGTAFLSGTLTPEQDQRVRALDEASANRETYGLEGFAETTLPTIAEQSGIFARTMLAGGAGYVAGASIGALAGAVLTRSAFGAELGSSAGAKVLGGMGAKALIAYDMAVQEASNAALDYRSLTDDAGNKLDDETIRGMALIAGGISGAFELLSFEKLAEVVPGVRGAVGREAVRRALSNPTTRQALTTLAKNVGIAMATEGVTEGIQSLTTQFGGKLAQAMQNEGGDLSASDAGVAAAQFLSDPATWTQALAEGRAGVQSGGGMAVAAGSVSAALDIRRIHQAERAHAGIVELAKGLGDSEVAKAAPVEVRDLLATQKAAGVEGFYYSADDWTVLWQGAKDEDGQAVADPATAAHELLGESDSYEAAKAAGGTFFVPLESWQKLTANPQMRQWATDHARTAPDALSAIDATRQQKAVTDTFTDLIETAVAAKEEAKPVDETAAMLEERVTTLVRAAGRPVREARAAGRLWGSVFRAFAESSGTSAEDLLKRFEGVRIGDQGIAVEREEIRQAVETATPDDVTLEQQAKAEVEAADQAALAGAPVRDARGRLAKVLGKVSDAALVAEYRAMRDRQSMEEGEITALESTPEFMARNEMSGAGLAEDRRGVEFAGGKRVNDVVQATALNRGRIAARAKGLERMSAELARRGIDPDVWALQDEADTSFDFGANVLEQAAFHGSPHLFDKFTTAKMGTGEGAQAYGWGLYFAENEGIAEGYRKRLSGDPYPTADQLAQYFTPGRVVEGYGGFDRVVKFNPATDSQGWSVEVRAVTKDPATGEYRDAPHERNRVHFTAPSAKQIERVIGPQSQPGALYRVDIRDEAVATFLDWDKPLSEQAPEVRAALKKAARTKTEGGRNVKQLLKDEKDNADIETMTGAAFYDKLSYALDDSPENASRYLTSIGIRGIKFLDAGSRSQGDGTRNLVVFDENDVTITHRNGEPVTAAERAQVLEQAAPSGDARGRISFSPDRLKATIELFEKADPSTFLHESAHFFLSLMADLAAAEGATDRIKADYAGLRAWLGAEEGKPLTVEQEEQFARGFEAFLMEGKAPSRETRTLFASFAHWLTKLYKQLTALKVTLTPEVREIMGRLVASESSIKAAQEYGEQEPLFPDAATIMPAPEAARYIEAWTLARDAAEAQVARETMAVVAREDAAWFKARRAEVRPEVEAEVHADPAYRARATLTSGKMPDGTPLPEGDPLLLKMDKAALVALVGEETVKKLPRPYVYRVSGGIHPDAAADALGYPNGAALVNALLLTEPQERHIDRLTDERLTAEYGDPMTDGTLPDRAMAAIQSAERDRVVKLELEHLFANNRAALQGFWRRIGQALPTTASLMADAERMLQGRTLKSIRPVEFERAQAKAAKEARAAAAKGDFAAAVAAKMQERVALALTRTALDIREDLDKARKQWAKAFQSDEKLSQSRDMNLVNAIRAILANIGVGRTEESAADYLKAMKSYDPETAADIEELVAAPVVPHTDPRDLTLAEFTEVRDRIEAIWQQSKATRQQTIDGKKIDRAVVVEDLETDLAQLPDRMKGAGRTQAFTSTDLIKRKMLGLEAALRRVESWVDQMDGGKPDGKFRRYIWTPISEAAALFRVAKRDLTLKYLELAQGLSAERMALRNIEAPLLGYTFRDKAELLGAMLHTGNASNLDKLIRGRQWDASAWASTVRTWEANGVLDEADYRFLQSVWDLFESVKPDAQKVHKAMLGYYFDEITAQPFTNRYGTWRGGYVPALADPLLSEDAQIRQAEAEAEGLNATTMFPNVGRGFTKGRVQQYARPLVMDLRQVNRHIDAVTRFIHLGQPTREVGRLLMDRGFRSSLAQVDPTMGAELVLWAQRAGRQVVATPSTTEAGRAVDTMSKALRARSGLGIMVLNVTNTLQQFTGLSIAAVKVAPKHLRSALWAYVRNPKAMSAAISELSPFMATRQTASVIEIEARIDTILLNPGQYDRAKAWATEHGYALQQTTQGIVDAVTWRGAFDQAVAKGADEKAAVREADAAVRLTQGSFSAEDISRAETGSPFVRLFTMFYSYFNMQANLLRSEFATAARQMGLRQRAGRMLYVYAMGFMMPAMLSQLIVNLMAGSPPDDADDDESYLWQFLEAFFGSQTRGLAAMVPGGNVLLTATVNQFNDKWYDDRVSVSPAVSTIESARKGFKDVTYDWWRGDVKRGDIRDVLTLLSVGSGVPFTAFSRPASYLYDVQTDHAQPTGPLDFARGLVSGRP